MADRELPSGDDRRLPFPQPPGQEPAEPPAVRPEVEELAPVHETRSVPARIEILPATPLDSLPKRTREVVEAGLMPDEPVRVVIRGARYAAIIGTDRRAFIFKRGLASGATFGHKLASFAYENIVGIEVHTGALTGAVVIHVPGAVSVSTSYWHGAKSDPHKAYNAIPIVRPYAAAQEGAAELRATIAAYTARPSHGRAERGHATAEGAAPPPTGASVDVIDAIRRLGELRDAGVLSEAEFEAKKAELLARL